MIEAADRDVEFPSVKIEPETIKRLTPQSSSEGVGRHTHDVRQSTRTLSYENNGEGFVIESIRVKLKCEWRVYLAEQRDLVVQGTRGQTGRCHQTTTTIRASRHILVSIPAFLASML